MSLQLFAIDKGNWGVKAVTTNRETFFRHAMKPLTQAQWETAHQRINGGHEDYLIINGQPYVFGQSAIRSGNHQTLLGAERYQRTYYGPFAAAAMFRCFDRSMKRLHVISTHAPRDIDYRRDIAASIEGEWEVEDGAGKKLTFKVVWAKQMDEPISGVRNVMFTNRGKMAKNTLVKKGDVINGFRIDIAETVVLDVGGETTDFAFLENGIPDLQSLTTIDTGIFYIKEQFWRDVKKNNARRFQNARKWDERRIHHALRTGQLDGGGLGIIDTSRESNEALNVFMDEVIAMLNTYNARAAHNIVVTGGGGAVIYDRLVSVFSHPNIILAGEMDDIHMANARGAYKAMRVLEEHGKIA